jgi:Flp pilus assembly protein TadD
VALTLAVYAPTLRHGFVNYDDPEYVVENPHVRDGLTVANVRSAFTGTHSANWHPLTWLSHMLDCELYGIAPTGHHATSVVLHAANAGLLFGVLATATGATLPSAFVAAAFALHPLRVESVTWISERKDVLAGFFWMLTLAAWLRYAKRPRLPSYALVVAAFALGLLAKPMVVTLPFVLLLLDLWPLRRERRRPVAWEIAPLVALSAGVSVLTFLAQRTWGAVTSLDTLPIGARVANAVVSFSAYVEKTVWPAGLAVFYPPRSPGAWQVAASALLLLAATALALRERHRRPYLLVGWLWYVGTLVPVLGLVQVGEQAMADRFTYLPQIGLLVMVAWAAAELPLPRAALGAAAGVALAALAAVTVRQQVFWADSVALFTHAAAVTRDNYVAEANIGAALLDRGDRDGAIPHLREAIRIRPGYAKPHVSLGKALAEAGDANAAGREYAVALAIDPGNPQAQYNLGLLRVGQGRLDEGIAAYREALRIDPGYTKARHNLGVALAAADRLPEAVEEYRKALALAPDLGVAHGNLAIALERLGRRDEAIAEYRVAVTLMPGDPTARYNLAACLVGAGRLPEAAAELREALRLRPGWPEGRAALAEVEAKLASPAGP